MNVTRYAMLAPIFILSCVGEFQTTKAACAAEPTEYSRLMTEAKRFWTSADQRIVAVNWNPKAPQVFNLVMSVIIDVHEGKLIVYSSPDDREQSFAAYFDQTGVLVADGHLRTVALVPPFDPRDGGATTGLPAEGLATQLLGMANAVPFLAAFDVKQSRRLTRQEELKLSQAIYPDAPTIDPPFPKLLSILECTTGNGVTEYKWVDIGGIIFKIESKACNEELVMDRRKEFRWLANPRNQIPIPKLSSLVEHLVKAKAIDGPDGDVITDNKDGDLAANDVDDRNDVLLELVRVRVGKYIGAITVGRACPLRVKSAKAFTRHGGDTIGHVAASVDVGDSRVFALDGQDWAVSVMIPGMDAGNDVAARVATEVERWLRRVEAGL